MFGIDIDDITLEPKEIGDTVYVPYHASKGEMEVTTFLPEERVQELLSDDDDSLGTDDYRFDP